MGYIKGIGRNQLMLPESLEKLVREAGPVHIIDAFMDGLDMQELGFERSEAAETGRPGYAPRDLLKLYLYGYLNKRKKQYEEYVEELKQSGETQKLTTDPEARMMKTKDGFHCCYNVQTAVDRKSHLIAGCQVTSAGNDSQVLDSFTSQVKKTLGKDFLLVTASRNLKTVKFGPETKYVAARMYGQKDPVISPPLGS